MVWALDNSHIYWLDVGLSILRAIDVGSARLAKVDDLDLDVVGIEVLFIVELDCLHLRANPLNAIAELSGEALLAQFMNGVLVALRHSFKKIAVEGWESLLGIGFHEVIPGFQLLQMSCLARGNGVVSV